MVDPDGNTYPTNWATITLVLLVGLSLLWVALIYKYLGGS